MKHKRNFKKEFEGNPYEAVIRIRREQLKLLNENKKDKSAAAFLDQIVEDYFKPSLFKNGKTNKTT